MIDVLTGKTEHHLCAPEDATAVGARIHRHALEPFRALRREAQLAGFRLRVLSGFRSYGRQLAIWNDKATGRLPVLDSDAVELELQRLSETDLVFAILRWSALPGASRHHWGTDLDVYDAAAKPEGYEIQLTPQEVNAGGMFAPLHEWLDERIAADRSFGFFRPYDRDRGGVAPERWHLSHAPLAAALSERLTLELVRATVEEARDMRLRETVTRHLDTVYERFVTNVNPATPTWSP